MSNIYIIGSLRDPNVPEVAKTLREDGHDVFDDWYAAGEVADDRWMVYEQTYRDHSLREALQGRAARHVFEFDREWLDWATVAVLVLPAGKSAHLELGYMAGKGKRTYVLYTEEPERFDVMYQFATDVFTNIEDLRKALLEGDKNGATTQGQQAPATDSLGTTGQDTTYHAGDEYQPLLPLVWRPLGYPYNVRWENYTHASYRGGELVTS
jgi:hypothetical protein